MVRVTFAGYEEESDEDVEDLAPIDGPVLEHRFEIETSSYRILESMYSPIDSNEAVVPLKVGKSTVYLAIMVTATPT